MACGAAEGWKKGMIGVVLWKNAKDGSAVIWCEDQGDLAFLNDKDQILAADAFFDVGDVVEFDVTVENNLRGVENLCRTEQFEVVAQSYTGAINTPTAKVIPFRANSAWSDPADELPQGQSA